MILTNLESSFQALLIGILKVGSRVRIGKATYGGSLAIELTPLQAFSKVQTAALVFAKVIICALC